MAKITECELSRAPLSLNLTTLGTSFRPHKKKNAERGHFTRGNDRAVYSIAAIALLPPKIEREFSRGFRSSHRERLSSQAELSRGRVRERTGEDIGLSEFRASDAVRLIQNLSYRTSHLR